MKVYSLQSICLYVTHFILPVMLSLWLSFQQQVRVTYGVILIQKVWSGAWTFVVYLVVVVVAV